MNTLKTMIAGVGVLLAFALGSGGAMATPVTGTPSDNPSFGTYCCNPANSNLDNFNLGFHHVLLNDFGVGFVELNFVNPTNFPAWYEFRIDGEILTSGTAHPTVAGDYIHDFVNIGANDSLIQSFSVNENIEVRSAFGPERDYDFDWTRFDALAVPAPAALPIVLIGFGALGLMGRRRKS